MTTDIISLPLGGGPVTSPIAVKLLTLPGLAGGNTYPAEVSGGFTLPLIRAARFALLGVDGAHRPLPVTATLPIAGGP
jgi:hypothetical protein